LFEYIAKNGKYSIGFQDTMYALESGTVETLLVWDQLPHMRTELKSNSTSAKKMVYHLPDQQVSEASGEWEIASSEPLLDWMLDHYKDFGASVEFVSDRSSVGNQFATGFGGIAGFLRFDIPLPSQSEDVDEGEENADEEEDSSDVEYTW